MRIVIHCLGMPFDGDTIKHSSLGGSETAAYAMARGLADIGHKVILFTRGKPGEYDGVIYENCGEVNQQFPLGQNFQQYAQAGPCDVLVIQRHPFAFSQKWSSKLNIWWTHDLALGRHSPAVQGMMWNVDQILTVSEWHKEQLCSVYDTDPEFVTATRNGIFPGDFPERKVVTANSLLFSNRPERGLEHLIKPGGIMEQLGPNFSLDVCHYDNTTEEMAGYYQGLWQRCHEMPNVNLLGALTKADLYKKMAGTWLQVYPSDFEETSCITAMETQAAGLPIIASHRGALPETLKNAGAILVPLKNGEVDCQKFAKKIQHLAGDLKQYEGLRATCHAERYDWKPVAKEWESLFCDLLAERGSNKDRLARHYWRHEDIMALKDLGGMPPSIQAHVDEYYGSWVDDEELYREKYLDFHTNGKWKKEKKDLRGNPRAMAIAEHLKDLPEGSRVVDIGSADGAISITLARLFPKLDFLCLDIVQESLDFVQEWADELEMENVSTLYGDIKDLPEDVSGADCIILAEIMEHLPHPADTLNHVRESVGGDPMMVITTPYGPWDDFRPDKSREESDDCQHLHHFEPNDYTEMFGHLRKFHMKIVNYPHTTIFGDAIGNLVARFYFTDDAKPVDYTRKHKQQAPRETIALCMIAKDAADTIGAALRSCQPFMDSMLVAVDERTTDETKAICLKYGARTIDIPAVTDEEIDGQIVEGIGFGAARNLSIAEMDTDWILWLDSDEKIVHGERLWKYLRASQIQSFGLPQHHLSVEPPGVMKTDYPSRVFRNRIGIEFFGLVHEHPELKKNEGPGRTAIIADVEIAHPAYLTEEIRKARFIRNWPLLRRELAQPGERRKLLTALALRDCAYMAQDLKSGQGSLSVLINGDDPREVFEQMVEEGVQLFQELLEDGNLKMIVDFLENYTLLNLVSGVGFNYAATIAGASMDENLRGAPVEIKAKFRSRDELNKILALANDEMIDPLTRKYH